MPVTYALVFLLKYEVMKMRQSHFELLSNGPIAWNNWRNEYPEVEPDLSSADLSEKNLSGYNLHSCNLQHATLANCDLQDVNLTNANLEGANLTGSYVYWTTLRNAKICMLQLAKANVWKPIL